ncbi:hypothetical protein AOLI_G00310400 [Acnodon oligacanthus]
MPTQEEHALLLTKRSTSEPRCFWLKREAAAAPESNGDTACSAAAVNPYTMFSSTGRSLSSPPLNLAGRTGRSKLKIAQRGQLSYAFLNGQV